MMTWFPPLYLDGFGLFYKVLGVSNMGVGTTYQSRRMFAILLATLYVIKPLLDTMGLSGVPVCRFGVSHRIWGRGTSWVQFFVSILGDLS